MSLVSFEGKTAVVTGGGSGIGQQVVWDMLELGGRVVAVDLDEEGLKTTESQTAHGGRLVVFVGDVSKPEDSAAMMEAAVDAFGGLDILVANAGVVGTFGSMLNVSAESVARTLRINVVGVFLGIRDAARIMKERGVGGSIVVTASVAGLRAGAGPVDYSASKAAVIGMVSAAASDLAPNSMGGPVIRVNAVAPGLVETGMTRPLFELARAKGSEDKIGQLNPCRRPGFTSDISSAVMFLASDQASSYVNGQVLAVDGGLSSSHPVVPPKLVSKL